MSAHCSLSRALVSLATPPILGIIVACEIYLDVSQFWGQASLELFRGERLPILPISLPPPHSPQ